jgi:vacuolar-type H+-ATPase subunit H
MSSSDRTARRREIEDSTAARLAEIVAAAEEAARQVIDEAEEEARSRIIDAREEADRIVADRLAVLAELTEEISAQADALRRQSEALQRALAEARAELGVEDSPSGSTPLGRRSLDRDLDPERDSGSRRPSGPALTVVASAGEDRRGAVPEPGDTPAGARLLATQMAVSGSSRAEIEERLRNGFAINDTRAILDAILGPEN